MKESQLKPMERPMLNSVVCWTRMQAESGESIHEIVHRKEIERKAGGGLFFWGIGNAPNRFIPALASRRDDVDVVFSLMKSRPKACDTSPKKIVVWNTYFDQRNVERKIPRHVLVTSRQTIDQAKTVHYALICSSATALVIANYGSFDPNAYRNISEARGRIAPSQVTALVTREHEETASTAYSINLHARLANSYWVRLGRPTTVGRPDILSVRSLNGSDSDPEVSLKSWRSIVDSIRAASRR